MKYADRLKVSATGTNVLTMGAAVAGCRTLNQVINDGASDTLAIKVGDSGVPFTVVDASNNWYEGLFHIDSATQITLESLKASSSGGTNMPSLAGTLTVFNAPPGWWLSSLPSISDGQPVNTLPTVTTAAAGAYLLLVDTDGSLKRIPASAFNTGSSGGTTTPSDTTAPTLSSPTATQTGQTTASGTVSTNEANGTLYRYVSANATETAATIKAANLTSTVTATGVQNVTFTGLPAGATLYAHYVHRDAAGNDSTVANSASFTTAAAVAAPVYQARTTNAQGQKINGVNFFPDGTGANATLQGSSPNYFTRDTNTFVSVYKTSDGSYPATVKFVWSKSPTQQPIVYTDTALPANSVNGNTIAYTDAVLEVGLIYGNTFSAGGYVRGTPGTYYLWALTPDGGAVVYDNGTGTPIGWTVKAPV